MIVICAVYKFKGVNWVSVLLRSDGFKRLKRGIEFALLSGGGGRSYAYIFETVLFQDVIAYIGFKSFGFGIGQSISKLCTCR